MSNTYQDPVIKNTGMHPALVTSIPCDNNNWFGMAAHLCGYQCCNMDGMCMQLWMPRRMLPHTDASCWVRPNVLSSKEQNESIL